MAVLRLTHFKIDPADTDEMLAKRGALIAAVRDAFPGLIEARLGKVDDETWVDVWRWHSLANAEAAIANAAAIPQAAAAFALTKDITAEFAELVDER